MYQSNYLDVNIESPFRGICDRANRVAVDSSIFSTPWVGAMLERLTALIPRSIHPDKPDAKMGNYFAHYLDDAAPDDYIHKVSMSIPIEFAANYRYIAGFLSF